MPATVPFTLHAESGQFSNAYLAAFGVHRSLLPAMRAATGFDRMHGQRWSLGIDRISASSLTGRIGVPVDSWIQPLAEALVVVGESGRTLTVAGAAAVLVEFAVDDVTEIEALASAVPIGRVSVEFESVTVFSAGDRGHRSVADPRLMVRSWARAWDEAAAGVSGCPTCPADVVASLGTALAPVAGALRWERAEFGRRGQRVPAALTGFTGSLTLALPPRMGGDAEQWLARLAAIAPAAGTGFKPQHGLGRTRVLPESAGRSTPRSGASSADAV